MRDDVDVSEKAPVRYQTDFWPASSFWIQDQYAKLPPADLPNPPLELNPYLPWWWRFERATVMAMICIGAGLFYSLHLALIAWLWGNVWFLVMLAEAPAAGIAIGAYRVSKGLR